MRALAAVFVFACAAAWAQQQYPINDVDTVNRVVNEAVENKVIPGAVLLIGHDGQVVYRRAYGERALVPQRETMTLDTIFDAASLTKVVATTPCVMKPW